MLSFYLKVQLEGKLGIKAVVKFSLGFWGHKFTMNTYKLFKNTGDLEDGSIFLDLSQVTEY